MAECEESLSARCSALVTRTVTQQFALAVGGEANRTSWARDLKWSQLATDATMVSPIRGDGRHGPHCAGSFHPCETTEGSHLSRVLTVLMEQDASRLAHRWPTVTNRRNCR